MVTTAYSPLADLNCPTRALTGLPVKARVWFLIDQAGSRAQHLQMPYRRPNTGARQCEAAVLASFGVFCGNFMAMMAAAREIARVSGAGVPRNSLGETEVFSGSCVCL